VIRVVKVVLLLMSCVSSSVVYGDTFTEVGMPESSCYRGPDGRSRSGCSDRYRGDPEPRLWRCCRYVEIFLTDGVTFPPRRLAAQVSIPNSSFSIARGLVFMPKTMSAGSGRPQLCSG